MTAVIIIFTGKLGFTAQVLYLFVFAIFFAIFIAWFESRLCKIQINYTYLNFIYVTIFITFLTCFIPLSRKKNTFFYNDSIISDYVLRIEINLSIYVFSYYVYCYFSRRNRDWSSSRWDWSRDSRRCLNILWTV